MENNDYESPFQFTYYGAGFGILFKNSLYDEYLNKIDRALTIIADGLETEEIDDVLEVLKTSLENGKDFYTNAKPYMREKMEEYKKRIEEGCEF